VYLKHDECNAWVSEIHTAIKECRECVNIGLLRVCVWLFCVYIGLFCVYGGLFYVYGPRRKRCMGL